MPEATISIVVNDTGTHVKIDGDANAVKLGIASAVQSMAAAEQVPVTNTLNEIYSITVQQDLQDFIKAAKESLKEGSK